MWIRLIKRLLLVSVLLGVSVAATARWAHQQSKNVPEFYERAIQSSPTVDLTRSSEELEANVQQLQDDVAQIGSWEAVFAAEQINAWLIEQLPKRFPTLKKRGLQDPRIVIKEGVLKAAARFKDHRFDAVVSCELSVRVTDHPNRLAVTVHAIRAGTLPLPLPISQFKERIKKFASKTKMNLQWETRDGQTIALIDVPSQYPGQNNELVFIDSIELSESHLKVGGLTGDPQSDAFAPRGPIYRLASFSDDPNSELFGPIRNAHFEGPDLHSSSD